MDGLPGLLATFANGVLHVISKTAMLLVQATPPILAMRIDLKGPSGPKWLECHPRLRFDQILYMQPPRLQAKADPTTERFKYFGAFAE